MANESANAGAQLKEPDRLRAATSRYSYSAFQVARALPLTTPLRGSLPANGNWDHFQLANAPREGALHHLGIEPVAADSLRSRFPAARHARVIADHGAGLEFFQSSSVIDAQKAALELIALSHRHGAFRGQA